jgi:hypothetical protein
MNERVQDAADKLETALSRPRPIDFELAALAKKLLRELHGCIK